MFPNTLVNILAILSFIFSVASFAYVNYDRRVKLIPRARKGKWCVLDPMRDGKETILRGIDVPPASVHGIIRQLGSSTLPAAGAVGKLETRFLAFSKLAVVGQASFP